MKTKILATTAGLSLLALVIGWATASSATTSTSAGKSTRVDSKQTSLHTSGNTLTLTDDYFQNGKNVGGDQIVCTQTGPGPLAICTAVNQLPKGQIISVGSVTIPPATNRTTTVAVVGGTGSYTTARGTVDITANSSTDSTNVFHISG
jgi:hypothetical protein